MLLKLDIDKALKMPARRFFCLLKSAREIDYKRRAEMLYELTYISTCSNSTKDYVTKIATHYYERFNDKKVQEVQAMSNAEAASYMNMIAGCVAYG